MKKKKFIYFFMQFVSILYIVIAMPILFSCWPKWKWIFAIGALVMIWVCNDLQKDSCPHCMHEFYSCGNTYLYCPYCGKELKKLPLQEK